MKKFEFFGASRSTRQRHFKKTSGSEDENDHFTVVSLVAWPLNESEAVIDLVLIGTSMLFLC